MEMAADGMSAAPHAQAGVTQQELALFEAAQLVMKNHCYNCHGATKQKGDLRLDQEVAATTGGESGVPSIVPGDAHASYVVERMLLPREDEDAMPPESKTAVTEAGIQAIVAWIEAGAVWPDMHALRKRISTYVEIDDPETEAIIDAIDSVGGKAEYNSWDDPRIRVDLSFTDEGKLNEALAELSKFGDQLIWLDVSGLDLPSSFYADLGQYTNLQRLHLDRTKVSDADLAQLVGLKQLVYLNLYGTQITDAGLVHLKQIQSLEKVFLGGSKVSSTAAKQLARSKEELVVVHR